MKPKDVTILIAHPDDEFLFGWPVLSRAKTIIACVDDMTHPQRQWCKRRKEAFSEIGKLVGAETVCLRHDSNFAYKPDKDLAQFVEEVRSLIQHTDLIFTHNGWGEYGHLDHILLNQIVRMSSKRMLTTDICLQADRWRVIPYHQGVAVEACTNDKVLHDECMNIYKSFGAMGWTYPSVDSCNLIEVSG